MSYEGYDDTEKTCKNIATIIDNDCDGDDDESRDDGACRRSSLREPEVLPLLPLLLLAPPLELLVVVPVPPEDEELLEPLAGEVVGLRLVPFFCIVMTMAMTMMPMTTRTVMMMQHCFFRMDFWISIASATSEQKQISDEIQSRFRSEGCHSMISADGM